MMAVSLLRWHRSSHDDTVRHDRAPVPMVRSAEGAMAVDRATDPDVRHDDRHPTETGMGASLGRIRTQSSR
ncbi:MAG TPA: hypothetical protein DDZ76_15900 [Xanthomonadales bacterium]|nr:hypothetical protein [Xanthomonadales bacterium]